MRMASRGQFIDLIVGLGALVLAGVAAMTVLWINADRIEAANADNRKSRIELAQADAVL